MLWFCSVSVEPKAGLLWSWAARAGDAALPAGVAWLWVVFRSTNGGNASASRLQCRSQHKAAFISLYGIVKITSPISLKIPEPVWGRAHNALSRSAPQHAPGWRGEWEPGASRAVAFSEPVTVVNKVSRCPAVSSTCVSVRPSPWAYTGCPTVPTRDPSQAWTSACAFPWESVGASAESSWRYPSRSVSS